MKSNQELQKLLVSIDGKGYGAYKDLKGDYNFGQFILQIAHVQGDPFAAPSKVSVTVEKKVAGFPEQLMDDKVKQIATSDFLTRLFATNIDKLYDGTRGSGKSGLLQINTCGPQMLERSAVIIGANTLELRFEVGLPAAGRKVLGKAASYMFCEAIPKLAAQTLSYKAIDQKALKQQVELMLNQQAIRQALKEKGLVAFVANGSILPRKSGNSQLPLKKGIAFKSPESLEVEMNLPYGGVIKGMGIKEGITLIVGGGYHGKSTLLNALELGVYNHVLGDGREYVITRADAVKIRAEDGRNVEKVNISAFINHLPNGKDTLQFSTENASGSTSQATNVIEALELGAKSLLIDEDTSATNFMIRDSRMQRLVKKEPITPFIDQVKQLYTTQGVSTLLVVGGSGDYFEVADTVIMMDEYVPVDVTEKAKAIALEMPQERVIEAASQFEKLTSRVPMKAGFGKIGRDNRLKVRGKETILFGKDTIDLSYVEQLVETEQTQAIAVMLEYMMKQLINDQTPLAQSIEKLYQIIEQKGLGALAPYTSYPGNLALPRKHELAAMINRYRGLKIK